MKIVGCFELYLLLACIDAKDQNSTKAETSTATTTVKLETKPAQTNVSNFRKNLKNTELNDDSTKNQTTEVLDLKDFIQRVADIALTYDDKEFENFFAALDNELRNHDCKECTIDEISKSPDIQAFIISTLNEVKLSSTPAKRLLLKQVAAMMESSSVMESSLILDYLNHLHSNNTQRLTTFLHNLTLYKRNTTRSNQDIQSIIHNGFQSLIVDPYSNLNQNARKGLKLHLESFFQKKPKEKIFLFDRNEKGETYLRMADRKEKSHRTDSKIKKGKYVSSQSDSDVEKENKSDTDVEKENKRNRDDEKEITEEAERVETENSNSNEARLFTQMRVDGTKNPLGVSTRPVFTANDDYFTETINLQRRNQKGRNKKAKSRRFFSLTFDTLEENISKPNEENFYKSEEAPVRPVTSKSKHGHKQKLNKRLKQNVTENENVRKVDEDVKYNRQRHKKNKSKKKHSETDKQNLEEIVIEKKYKREETDLKSGDLSHATESNRHKVKKNKVEKGHSESDQGKLRELVIESENKKEEKDLNSDDLSHPTESNRHKVKKNKRNKSHSETDKEEFKGMVIESKNVKKEEENRKNDDENQTTKSKRHKIKKNKLKKGHSESDKQELREIVIESENKKEEKDLNSDDLSYATESNRHKHKKNKNKKSRLLRELKTLETQPDTFKNKLNSLPSETPTNSATFFITFDGRKRNDNVEKAFTVTGPSDSSKVQSNDSIMQQVTLISKDDKLETTGIQTDEVTQHSQPVDVRIETAGVIRSTNR